MLQVSSATSHIYKKREWACYVLSFVMFIYFFTLKERQTLSVLSMLTLLSALFSGFPVGSGNISDLVV